MAILMEIEIPGVAQEQYDALSARIQSGEVPADGCLMHASVLTERGVHVTDLWTTREAMDAFMDRLMPVAKELGFPDAAGPPSIRDVHEFSFPDRA